MRKAKSAAALLMASVILLTACGSGDTSNTSGSTTESKETAKSTETQAAEAVVVEEVKGDPITVYMMQELFSDTEPDLGNEWYTELTEMTNVVLDVAFIPTLSYVDKITTTIADKQLAQIFTANSSVLKNNLLLQALQSDGFWELDDYIMDYPNLYEFVGEDTWNNSRKYGRIYGIPRLRALARNGAVIRQDWLDALGLENPTTIEEFIEVLRAFTEDDPDGNGKKDTFGWTTAYAGTGNRGWNGVQALATYLGAPNGWAYTNGEVIPDFSTEAYFQALTYIKQIYDAGYMNKDFATISATDKNVYFDQGNCGIIFCTMDDINGRYENLSSVESDCELTIMNLLAAEKGAPIYTNATSGFNGIVMFNKFGDNAIETEEELRAILAFYDKLCTEEGQELLNYGVEGVTYKVADGKRELIMDGEKTALSVKMGDIGQILPLAAYVRKDDDSEMQNTLYDAFESRVNNVVIDVSTNLTSETYAELGSTLDQIMMDVSVKYILGEIDESEYWAGYENWLNQGGKDVIKEFTAFYEEYIK